MDTGTHFVMGFGLFGLAHLDPIVASETATAHAVLIGTVAGSQLPDLDGLYRLKGNSAYIRNHRGWSHSLPMLAIWPTLLSALIYFFFPEANWLHLWLWSFLAVVIHVSIDLFNAYGTQALRPVSYKWISLDIINIFDPFLFLSHIIGFGLWWILPTSPGTIFAWVYALIILYIIWRTYVHAQLLRSVKGQINGEGKCTVAPTFRPHVWNVIWEEQDRVLMGEIRKGQKITWTGKLSTDPLSHPATVQSRKSKAVSAFLSFSSYGYPQVFTRSFGYEVRWLDVRYHHKKRFPFVAVALLDTDMNILDSFVGWMNEEQLEKRVASFGSLR